MPVYFRIPLPGPFGFSKRIGGPRRYRRSREKVNSGSIALVIYAMVALGLTIEFWYVVLPLAAVTAVVVVLVRRRRRKAIEGKTLDQILAEKR